MAHSLRTLRSRDGSEDGIIHQRSTAPRRARWTTLTLAVHTYCHARILAILLLAYACATAPPLSPEQHNQGSELERQAKAEWDRIKDSGSYRKYSNLVESYPNTIPACEALIEMARIDFTDLEKGDQLRKALPGFYPQNWKEFLAKYASANSPSFTAVELRERFYTAVHPLILKAIAYTAEIDYYYQYATILINSPLIRDCQRMLEDRLLDRTVGPGEPPRISDYEKFVTMFPQSSRVQQIRRGIDDLSYEGAARQQTSQAYSVYLAKFPDGGHVNEAQNGLEERLFREALRSKEMSRLEHFIGKYPNSRFVEDAHSFLERLKKDYEVYLTITHSQSADEVRTFVEQNPQNLYMLEIEQHLSHLVKQQRIEVLRKTFSARRQAQSAQLSPEEIFRKYADSVAVIKTDRGLGSGFAITRKGHIVTNRHVIQRAGVVKVLLSGEWHSCQIIHESSEFDLAVLKIDANIEPIPLGNTDDMLIGERIVVISNPRGFENTISDGLYSGMRGKVFFQYSAASSPGSSGGPVINADGKAIGFCTLKHAERLSENLNFAISIAAVFSEIEHVLLSE